MEGSSGSQNREQMIGTRGKIDAGRGIDSFWSGEPTEHSRDDETAEDARRRCKMTQENAGECRRTQGGAGRRSDETRTQDAGQDTGEMQGRCRVDAVIPGRVMR